MGVPERKKKDKWSRRNIEEKMADFFPKIDYRPKPEIQECQIGEIQRRPQLDTS